MATSLFHSPTTQHQFNYDVFLSFRGTDTRYNFTSHLYAALSRKSIVTFMDKNDIGGGEEIRDTIFEAIHMSRIAVIVFSKEYASSEWCLEELAKIFECRKTCKQLVLPIFYHVDPSDISEETAVCSDALPKYAKVHKWKDALKILPTLSGWSTLRHRIESELVDEVVSCVWEKLKKEYSSYVPNLVGIDSRIEEFKELLSVGSPDVRFVGIWGMGGIGKTTLAEAVFNQISFQFEGCCFLDNVKEKSEKYGGLTCLQEELLSKTLMERELKIDTPNVGYSFAVCRKRVLIVVDDVNSPQQLESLVGNRSWFGLGSRIIITSRDKQVLGNFVDDRCIYQVKELVQQEALQLFNKYAFKEKSPPEDYNELSHSVVEYAKGLPLALKVLGTSLYGKSQREWESAIDKLKKAYNSNIQNVLKISYDALDEEEKNIFLDIACFFRGESVDLVTKTLDECGFSTDIGLSNLMDKSLVTISEGKIEMHDLLQEMGREIVRQESKQPGNRSRLWNHQDIHRVLTKNMGSEAVESIVLDMSKIEKIHLNPDAFARMPNLRLLKFYNYADFEEDSKVNFLQNLTNLSGELRFLYWYAYPLKSLPANLSLTNLAFLKLPHSKLKRLWKGEKDLDKLIEIDLSYSKNLIKIPELSTARNLLHIKLSGCENITNLPNTIHLESLTSLDLKDCLQFKKFPEIPRNITSLYLSGTAIEEVPSSIACLSSLRLLEMNYCTKLESLPSSICNLRSLESLSLLGCSNLQIFPEILDTMLCLKLLVLNGTAIKELPSSIENLKGLSSIHLENCKNLTYLPESLCNLKALYWLFLTCCPKLEYLPRKFSNLTILEDLTAGGCNRMKLPSDLNSLSSISKLDLSGNNFEKFPASLTNLSKLKWFNISFCKNLRSLPELPHSVTDIDAHDCRSLENISELDYIFQLKYAHTMYRQNFVFTNCFKLDQSAWEYFVEDAQSWIQVLATRANNEECFSIWHPGSKIPKWFKYQDEGSSIKFPLQSDKHRLLGFVLCVVLAFDDKIEYQNSFLDVCCICHFKNDNDECSNHNEFYSTRTHVSGNNKYVGSDHVIVFYDPNFRDGDLSYNKASFEFYTRNNDNCYMQSCQVKKCAALPVYAEEAKEYCDRLEVPVEIRMNPEEDEEPSGSGHKRYWGPGGSSDEEEENRDPKKLKLLDGAHLPEDIA